MGGYFISFVILVVGLLGWLVSFVDVEFVLCTSACIYIMFVTH